VVVFQIWLTTYHYYKTGFCWLDFMTWTYNMTSAFYSQDASKNGPVARDIYDWWSWGPGRSLWHVPDGVEVRNFFGTALETSINLTTCSQVHMTKASYSLLLSWTSTSHVVLVVFVTVCSQSIYSFTMQLWLNTIIWLCVVIWWRSQLNGNATLLHKVKYKFQHGFRSDMLMSHFYQCTSIIHGTLDCGKSSTTTVAMSMTSKLEWPQSQGIVNSFRVWLVAITIGLILRSVIDGTHHWLVVVMILAPRLQAVYYHHIWHNRKVVGNCTNYKGIRGLSYVQQVSSLHQLYVQNTKRWLSTCTRYWENHRISPLVQMALQSDKQKEKLVNMNLKFNTLVH
jgi:hypothetical protein